MSVYSEALRVHESPRELLGTLWQELLPDLERLAWALGVKHGESDDVLQDVYVTAWQQCPVDLDRVELRRWLYRVTMNRCHLHHRRRTRWQRMFGTLTTLWDHRAEIPSTDDVATQREELQLVRHEIERLSPQARSIVVLRYFSGLDSSEIGAILDLPASTVRSQLRAARQQLAHALKRAGYDDE